MLDDCNFHQSVSLDKFEAERLLKLTPPDGEFAVMNYRSTYPFKPPFRVSTIVEDDPNTALKVSYASCRPASALFLASYRARYISTTKPLVHMHAASVKFASLQQVLLHRGIDRADDMSRRHLEGISTVSAGKHHHPDQPGVWIGQSSQRAGGGDSYAA